MKSRSKGSALILVGFAAVLWAWLAYDAGSVQRALGLGQVVSEGAVAVVGLGLVATSLVVGLVAWRRAVRSARPRSVIAA